MYNAYIINVIFTRMDVSGIFHTYFYQRSLLILSPLITHRESYVYDTECKFCAQESERLVSDVNTKICPDCYSWISNSVGLINLGIRRTSE